MLHLIYPPRHDATAMELARVLDQRSVAVAEISATRARLERLAAPEPIDDLADEL